MKHNNEQRFPYTGVFNLAILAIWTSPIDSFPTTHIVSLLR